MKRTLKIIVSAVLAAWIGIAAVGCGGGGGDDGSGGGGAGTGTLSGTAK
jgi:membrane-associated phospholipid phosphatase